MLKQLLEERALRSAADFSKDGIKGAREKILTSICSEEYGNPPSPPKSVSWEEKSVDNSFCAGKATLKSVSIKCVTDKGEFAFPVSTVIPNGEGRYPFFIHINFRKNVPDKYMPSEEICDGGYAVLSFCYEDVSSDDGDFTDGLAGVVFDNGRRGADDCGKIGLWAWAASRVMDYASTLACLDTSRAAVVGHSRLGKTALLAGALDERFACAISNDSGCSGAALARGTKGETIKLIYSVFPYWFCENYKKYMDNEASLPIDQHDLLSALAPRRVYVASAADDAWADPISEYLSCVAAGEAYVSAGLTGFVHPDKLPVAGDSFHEGEIGYHLRAGKHYLSREDWAQYMKYLDKHFGGTQ
ncbi:MAG: hypothetical protein AB9835_13270 [Eubacteriales bacterium]